MEAILGVIFHFIGGTASGSFYLPYKKVKGWSWESYWLIGGLFSWVIVPPVIAWLTVPGFAQIIGNASHSVIGLTFLMGLLWGIGGLTYGLGVRYLGMSLGNSVVLGCCSAFGSLVPPIYHNFFPAEGKVTISEMMASQGGKLVLAGVLVCLIGIFICGWAGMLKEKELTEEKKKESIQEFNLTKGLVVAVISGILSACFAFGIDAGKDMANVANDAWAQTHPAQGRFLFQNNVTYVVILWGGLTTNLIWCLILNFRNKTFGDYTNESTPLLKNYILCFIAGTLWFLQFFFYGMGESKLGNGASSWILHMASIILVANMWGLVLKEWKGVGKKTFSVFVAGIITIILSIVIVGYGNSLPVS
jgi:L-rhamnose-H+ transport protein